MPQKLSFKLFFRKILYKLRVYALIIIAAFAIFFILLTFNSYFRLRTIHIEGDIESDQITGLESLKGKNLYFLSTDSVTDVISGNNPNIAVDEVVKEFPNRLIIKLRSMDAIAQLKLNAGFAQLSVEGKIVKKRKTVSSLPIINFYQQFDYYQINLGNTLDYKEILTALFLLKICQNLDLEVESIDINDLSMIVFNLKEREFIFSAEKDMRKQGIELATLLTQFRVKTQDYKVLDLRFDKPIVKF